MQKYNNLLYFSTSKEWCYYKVFVSGSLFDTILKDVFK
jgi:hypothetical protein